MRYLDVEANFNLVSPCLAFRLNYKLCMNPDPNRIKAADTNLVTSIPDLFRFSSDLRLLYQLRSYMNEDRELSQYKNKKLMPRYKKAFLWEVKPETDCMKIISVPYNGFWVQFCSASNNIIGNLTRPVIWKITFNHVIKYIKICYKS